MTPPEGTRPRALAVGCSSRSRCSPLAIGEGDVGAGSESGGWLAAGKRRSSRGRGR
jgi:hypothetical protein